MPGDRFRPGPYDYPGARYRGDLGHLDPIRNYLSQQTYEEHEALMRWDLYVEQPDISAEAWELAVTESRGQAVGSNHDSKAAANKTVQDKGLVQDEGLVQD